MKILHRQVEDFKTERTDVTPPLPTYLRIVPLLFYGILAGGFLLSTHFYLQLRGATAAVEAATAENNASKAALVGVQANRASVEKQLRRANEVIAWVEGSRNLQPLIVGLIRSVEAPSSLVQLGLERQTDAPTQVKLKLELNTQSPRQLDATIEKISSMDFRIYSPNQTQSRGQIDYGAMLIHQTRSSPPQIIPEPAAPNEQ